MTLYRASIIDTPHSPFTHSGTEALRTEQDGGIVVRDGRIDDRGAFAAMRAGHPGEPVVDLTGGILLPGFVDTHVHYPQIRAIGGLGLPLLEWLDRCAVPEEMRLADPAYAAEVSGDFLGGLADCGTTSALVFGSHFAGAMEVFFEQAAHSGLNITAGLVLSDRGLHDDLLCEPEVGRAASTRLIERWHGRGDLRYAVTPRFSLSTSDEMLAVCAELMKHEGVLFTSHINENPVEVANVVGLFPGSTHYLDTYLRHGLVTERSVFAHNVHAGDDELALLGEFGAWVAHCPTSNAALGSGLFPMKRHRANGVGVALGSDVAAGTGLFIPKEALQAYFMQQLLGADGDPLTPAHLLYLTTAAGAAALRLADRAGDLGIGKRFDAVLVRPPQSSTLGINLRAARDPSDALARIFALAGASDIAYVWANGRPLKSPVDRSGQVGQLLPAFQDAGEQVALRAESSAHRADGESIRP